MNDVMESIKPGQNLTADQIKRIDDVQQKVIEMYDVAKQEAIRNKQPEKLNGI
jgi:hypothetical protein